MAGVTITKFWEVCKNPDPNLKTASTTLKIFFLNVREGNLQSQHLELPSGVSRASENVLQNTYKIEMMHLGSSETSINYFDFESKF